MRILGADPGGKTGWSLFEDIDVYQAGTQDPPTKRLERIDYGYCGPHQHHGELEERLFSLLPLDLIICERFEHRNNEFAELISLEYIGVIKALAQRRKIPLVMQGSSQAKYFVTNVKIRRLGWNLSPRQEYKDVIDSERHVVYWVCTSDDAPHLLKTWMLGIVSPR